VKLLFDQNLSPRLINKLVDLYPDSVHVLTIALDQSLDKAVWEYARTNDLVVVTKDADFSDFSIVRGFPPKVIWIRRGNCTTTAIEQVLRSNFDAITAFYEDTTAGVLTLF
jgi:predicted nuclease of predicted toxin-antitoxin system